MTVLDTFSGTSGDNLNVYDTDWTKSSAVTGNWLISSEGRARRGTSAAAGMYTLGNITPASPDYTLRADFHVKSTGSVERVGIIVRSAVNTLDFYALRITGGSTSATIALMEATGAAPVILTSTTKTIAAGSTYNLAIRCDDTTLEVLDGDNADAVLLTITDATLTGAGKIGLYFSSDSSTPGNSTGIHIDNLALEEAAAIVVDGALGQYEIQGFAGDIKVGTVVPGALGQYEIQGFAGDISVGSTVNVNGALGQYEIQGFNSTVNISSAISGALGQYEIQGFNANVTFGVTSAIDIDFPGCNINGTSSSITNAGTTTPVVSLVIRTPDDSEWQQWVVKLTGVAGKTVQIRILLTGKESDPDNYLGTYEGPKWATSITTTSAWNNTGSGSLVGSEYVFTVTPGVNDTIFVASVPPLTQDVALAHIQNWASTYPTLIHDDLPSRVALADGPYICGRSGTGRDENARTVSNLPMYGFRIGNDSLGTQPKRRVVMMCGVHSGEWNGWHKLKGAIEELLTGTYSTELLTNFDFYIYPLHSVLGNYLGFRRNEATPSASSYDSNREWNDGDTTVPTVVKWQSIMDQDHGVVHNLKVVYYIDFHDGKNTSDQVWYYYHVGMAKQAAYHALVVAENSNILTEESTIDGTTQDYWFEKGVNFSFNPEVADEKSTLVQLAGYGAAYMRSIKTANDAGMLNLPYTTACALGQYEIQGFAGDVIFGNSVNVNGALGQYEIQGFTGDVKVGVAVPGALGQYEIQGFAATVSFSAGYVANGALGQFEIQGFAGDVKVGVSVPGALGQYEVQGFAATVSFTSGYSISGALGQYEIQGFAATVYINKDISGALGQYEFQGFNANVSFGLLSPLLPFSKHVITVPKEKRRITVRAK